MTPILNKQDDDALLVQRGRRNAFVHDPSTLVRCGAYWYVFATGEGIPSWRSRDGQTWEPTARVFPDGFPKWVQEALPGHDRKFWAPDVIQVGNRYLLYYSVSRWGVNTSVIGAVANKSLDPADAAYQWTDLGRVVASARSNNYNAIDPSVARDARGGLWLAFGSFWAGIQLVQLDPASGLRMSETAPVYPLAWNREIEAACLYRRGRWHYLFVNWGLCCRGANSTYEIRMGRSERVTGPYRDKDGKDLLKGGGSLFLGTKGSFVGPGHAGVFDDNGKTFLSCHFYDKTRNGAPTLATCPLRFDKDGWPVA